MERRWRFVRCRHKPVKSRGQLPTPPCHNDDAPPLAFNMTWTFETRGKLFPLETVLARRDGDIAGRLNALYSQWTTWRALAKIRVRSCVCHTGMGPFVSVAVIRCFSPALSRHNDERRQPEGGGASNRPAMGDCYFAIR